MANREPAPDEEALRAAFDAGRLQEVTATFLAGHAEEIQRFLASYLGNAELAREVYCVFCEAFWKGLPSFEWRCSIRAWAYTLARHAAIRHGARQQNARRRADRLAAIEPEPRAASGRTSTAPYLRTDVKSRMRALREQLSPDDQALIILRVDRGLAWRELCAVLSEGGQVNAQQEARLRKRFQLLKAKLRNLAIQQGLLER